jgi:hypothetical protein
MSEQEKEEMEQRIQRSLILLYQVIYLVTSLIFLTPLAQLDLWVVVEVEQVIHLSPPPLIPLTAPYRHNIVD